MGIIQPFLSLGLTKLPYFFPQKIFFRGIFKNKVNYFNGHIFKNAKVVPYDLK